MIEKFMFVMRYLWVKLIYRSRVITDGFIFLEPDITFKIQRGGRVVIEKGAYFKKGSVFECAKKGTMLIKKGAVIGNYNWIGCSCRIKIGSKTLIASHVSIFDVNHLHSPDMYISEQGYTHGETIIGDDCLIGTKATIGPNVNIGTGSMIGANAVVTKDIPTYCIAAGIPAKVIKKREP